MPKAHSAGGCAKELICRNTSRPSTRANTKYVRIFYVKRASQSVRTFGLGINNYLRGGESAERGRWRRGKGLDGEDAICLV